MRGVRVLVIVGLLALAPLALAGETLPSGCERLGDTYVECAWRVEPGAADEVVFDVPPAGRGLIFLFIDRTDPAYAQSWLLCEKGKRTGCEGGTTHILVGPSHASKAYLFDVNFTPEAPLEFVFRAAQEVGPPVSSGPIDVRLGSEALPVFLGLPPSASADDPHLSDERGEPGTPPLLDILGAWFNDPYLEDGFINATIALDEVPVRGDPGYLLRYDLDWKLRGDAFRVRWTIVEEGVGATLYRRMGDAWTRVIDLPAVRDVDRDVLSASIALRLLGRPTAEEEFSGFRATAWRGVGHGEVSPTELAAPSGATNGVVDEASHVRRTFRLRSADDLAPPAAAPPPAEEPSSSSAEIVRPLDVPVAPAAVSAPWYQSPFSAENLPNTLQVAGALAATLTFLAGLLLLARRRSLVQKLVDELEDARAANAGDAQGLAAAVRAIESRAHDLAARGRLDAREFALITRRIDQTLGRA